MMMRKTQILAVLALSAALFSCKKEGGAGAPKRETAAKVPPEKAVAPEVHQELYGVYSGDFIGSETVDPGDGGWYEDTVVKKLSLKINRITRDSVYGHSIVEGNERPFRGIFREAAKRFVLDEPGSAATDGRFEVSVQGDSLVGKWATYRPVAVKAPTKLVKLGRRAFVYNPNLMLDKASDLVDWSNPKEFEEKYTDPDTHETGKYTVSRQRIASDAVFRLNASTQKLTEAQLKNLRKLDLEILKNSVFARHGYAFKKQTFRYFFEQTNWYVPVSNNVDAQLTPLEKENIALLSRFEKYAQDHYESFGR